jgi:hypothetical protein
MGKRWIVAACAATLGVGLLLAQGGPGGAAKGKDKGPGPCDRACLEGFVDQYLDALVAHNPFGLPLAARVKFSENDQLLDLGDGLWNVTTGIGKYRILVSDPQSQQVGFIGTLLENDRPVTLALRLKIDNRKISEIETLVHRAPAGGPPPATAKGPAPTPAPLTGAAALNASAGPDAVFTQAAVEGQRSSREQLVAAANAYFDAMERGDGSLAQFDPLCTRVENGVQASKAPSTGPFNPTSLGCSEQLSSKAYSNIQAIYPRRFPVVDEERQLVFGFFMQQQPGDILSVESPGRGTYKFSEAHSNPGFYDVAEVFKIAGGKIRRMESLSLAVPYGTPNPFFGDDWRRKK